MSEPTSQPSPTPQETEVLRKYAEFHRRLGGLLQELLSDAKVYWVGDLLGQAFSEADTRFANTASGHELHPDDAARNVYRKAIYVISDPEPYRQVLERLVSLQREVMWLTGSKRPYDGILEPVLVEDVALVRLRSHATFLQRELKPASLRKEVAAKLEGVRENAKAFEAVSLDDAATRRLYREIEALEKVVAALDELGEEPLLVRAKHLRVLPSVYAGGERARQVYVRDVGLILSGSKVIVEVPPASFKTRSDKVTREVIEPVAGYDNVTVYPLALWKERVRGETKDE